MTKATLLLGITLGAIAQLKANPPIIVGEDGQFLGVLSANPYEVESVANPYGLYGSPYSPVSVNDVYGLYGSPYSNESLNNPYLVSEPVIEEEVR